MASVTDDQKRQCDDDSPTSDDPSPQYSDNQIKELEEIFEDDIKYGLGYG